MQASATRSEKTAVREPARAAFLLAVLALLSASAGMSSRNPPIFHPAWAICWFLCFAAVVTALFASLNPKTDRSWGIAFQALQLALVAFLLPMSWYMASFHDYPRSVIGVMVFVVTIGGWFARQRIVAVLFPALLAVMALPAVLPPRQSLPAHAAQGDLSATLSSPTVFEDVRRSFYLDFPNGAGLRYDWELLFVEGTAAPLVPVDCWPSRRTERGVRITAFPPVWATSWDLTVKVPRMPDRPLMSLPLTLKAGQTATAAVGPAAATAKVVAWSSAEKTIALDISGCRDEAKQRRTRFLILDQKGRPVYADLVDLSRQSGQESYEFELPSLDPKANSVTVSVYGDDQPVGPGAVLEFRSVPTR